MDLTVHVERERRVTDAVAAVAGALQSLSSDDDRREAWRRAQGVVKAADGAAEPRERPVLTPEPIRTGEPDEATLRALLTEHVGNVAAVGRVYGKERQQVHRWMKRYGIDVAEYR